jgi:manganese transport protein
MSNPGRKYGPGLLVTAAFVGPGTITTASIAGANYGFALLWTLLFSVCATIILQEMSARLGLATRQGLAEAMRNTFAGSWSGRASMLLVIIAIGFGNAAYEAGNIAGASLGLAGLSGVHGMVWALLTGAVAAILLASGRYGLIEVVLVIVVLLMSLVFLLTALMVDLPWREMAQGLLQIHIPSGATLTTIALIGTTVVPYNLFLHASAVQAKWPENYPLDAALREARLDTGLSIGLGGLITLAVISTAAAAFFGGKADFSSATMADQLEPLLGPAARYFFAAGLFAAGLSSAVTAPLAAAYAVSGALGWPISLQDRRFRLTWMAVLVTGTVFAASGIRPLSMILMAQAANGFLLPVCAIYLLWVMNNRSLLGDLKNGPVANLLGLFVTIVTLGLGGMKLWQLL